MTILIDRNTRVLVQGITGKIGSFHAADMLANGANIVAGVTPGRGGSSQNGVPVFNTVAAAVAATGANATIVFVPPPAAADSIMEAADAGIPVVIAITDGIPTADMMAVKQFLRRRPAAGRTRLIGPNCAGIISPGECIMGIMPASIFTQGRVGIVARSGTLGYEAADQLTAAGLGVSTAVGIGGDPINGSSFTDILALFEADPGTDGVVLIGEIGGPQEVEAAAFIATMSKPVVAYIAGLSAPRGRKMGHAGAIVSGAGESAEEKVNALRAAGASIAPNPSEIGVTMARVLSAA